MNKKPGYRGIEVQADASLLDKCRKQVVAGQPGHGKFAFIADEGSYMPGGEASAPTPLTYFVSGVALCLLSHLSEISTKKRLDVEDIRVGVSARFHEEGSALKGDKTGACDGFDIRLEIDSSEPDHVIRDLMAMAQNVCFAVDALTREHPPGFTHVINGKET